ncbi:hypothetical protein [Streptomyces sp. NPDC059063]|uniref:hypothetical protein n=1 Tax=unclassified Streptomyces TaxID=2593676 RepID=UPI0036CE4D68
MTSTHFPTSSTPPTTPSATPDTLARLALKLDAAVTGLNGLAYLALAQVLDSFFGIEAAVQYPVGAFLLLYATAVLVIATREHISRPALSAVITANLLWTVLSVISVATDTFSPTGTGMAWALLQALVVAGFAAVQYVALGRLHRS